MKIIESIKILTKLARATGYRVELIIDFEFTKSNISQLSDKKLTLLNSLFYMTIIDSVSFLDEYDQYFGVKTEDKFKERAIIVKSINKPLVSKIREWKDLKDMRNELLAHNLRIGKNGKFIFGENTPNYDAPRTIYDLFLLSNLIQFTTETINSEFNSELKSIQSNRDNKTKYQTNVLTKEDVSSITADLLLEANELKNKYDRKYEFHIADKNHWNRI
jgi:hypothetical protein